MPRPNFFIVGAPKSGTSSMHAYLLEHPAVFMPPRPLEPNFFDPDLDHRWGVHDLDGYLAMFDAAEPHHRAIGEKSVWYLLSDVAARDIHAFDPDARIIAMLRNPVDLMYSLHGQQLEEANETISDFEQALSVEEERRGGARIPAAAHFPRGLLYREAVAFTDQLRRFYDVFPSDQIHVVAFDDFKQDTARVYHETLAFLELEPIDLPSYDRHRINRRVRSHRFNRFLRKIPRSLAEPIKASPIGGPLLRAKRNLQQANTEVGKRSPLDPDVRQRLLAGFEEEIVELERFLGRDLSSWRA